MSGLASRHGRRGVRAAVVACALLVTVLSLARMDEVMGLFDWRADTNAAATRLDRLYADGGVVMSREVIESARRTVPADGKYRVVLGADLVDEGRFTRLVVADFLRTFLLPRRQAADAPWVICYGCDHARLGGRLHVVADGGNGVVFGRLTP